MIEVASLHSSTLRPAMSPAKKVRSPTKQISFELDDDLKVLAS